MKRGVSLLLLTCLIYTLGVESAWIGNAEEETRFCRSVCDKCGCMGFSCGEECLCECHHKKVGDKYMACITDARAHVPAVDDYDIIVQGPNGNGRISRSVVTKDLNPEQIFPSEFVFNVAEEDNDGDESVAAPAATQDNINKGFRILKNLEVGPLPAPSSNFKALDHDALRGQFDGWRKNLADKVPSLPDVSSLPAPSFKMADLPDLKLPEKPSLPEFRLPDKPSLPEFKLPEVHHLPDLSHKLTAHQPVAPAPVPVEKHVHPEVVPDHDVHHHHYHITPEVPVAGNKLDLGRFKDFLTRPHKLSKTITINST